jgi:hypothetical protein
MIDNDVCLVIFVGPGRERYVDVLNKHVSLTWPDHPPVYFPVQSNTAFSNCKETNIINTNSDSFVGTVLEACKVLNQNKYKYVIMLLEDHVPLQRVIEDKIQSLIYIAKNSSLDCIIMPMFDWPWASTTEARDSLGRIIGWDKINTIAIGDQKLAVLPFDFFRYNACQPSIWNIHYLINIAEEALLKGSLTPWDFEEFTCSHQSQHYISDYKWPSAGVDGYLKRGRILWKAIRFMDKTQECNLLKKELVSEYFHNSLLPLPVLQFLGNILFALGLFQAFLKKLVRQVIPV